MRVPDTPDNRETFGGQSGRKGSESGYPMVAYNFVRLEMARIAAEADVEPTRISFVESPRPATSAVPPLAKGRQTQEEQL